MKILFADLDNTLIETKSGETFPISYKDWKLKIGIKEALLNYSPDVLHIVSNQGGITLGKVKKSEFDLKLLEIKKALEPICVTSDYCTALKKDNPRRKPNPGMILDYLQKNPGQHDCLMIGDASGRPGQFSDSDLMAAKGASIPYMDIDDFIERYK